jgi:hypothetical protein
MKYNYRIKDRVYGPVDRPVKVYGQKEYEHYGKFCFWLGTFMGAVVASIICILVVK